MLDRIPYPHSQLLQKEAEPPPETDRWVSSARQGRRSSPKLPDTEVLTHASRHQSLSSAPHAPLQSEIVMRLYIGGVLEVAPSIAYIHRSVVTKPDTGSALACGRRSGFRRPSVYAVAHG
jgi:hypothetical protein